MTKYIPEQLERWTLPECYGGAHWDEYYVFLGQHRDSDCLTRSNFECGLKAIGGEQTADDENETPLVTVVREGHWAVGWVEWIAIHETATEALKTAEEIVCSLSDYPVLDDEHFCEVEMDEANDVWRNCYNPQERIDYIRKNRSQFDFHDFADLLAQVRGSYFTGYASELIY